MEKLSDRFQMVLALSPFQQHKLAMLAGLEPSVLSKLVKGARPVNDTYKARLLQVARALGLSDTVCFLQEVSVLLQPVPTPTLSKYEEPLDPVLVL